MVLSARRSGACVALHWDGESRQYRCGALVASNTVLRRVLPVALRGLSPWLAPALARLAQRWIAVGHGCDSTVELADQERSGAA